MIELGNLNTGAYPHDWLRYHPRVFDVPGDVLDFGCLTWDWSKPFIGKKRVIGIDPQEEETPDGTILHKGLVSTSFGTANIEFGQQNAAIDKIGSDVCSMITYDQFIEMYDIKEIALLKMNIDGSEYDHIIRWKRPPADQLIISFHPWKVNNMTTGFMMTLLDQWYDRVQIHEQYNWWLFLKST